MATSPNICHCPAALEDQDLLRGHATGLRTCRLDGVFFLRSCFLFRNPIHTTTQPLWPRFVCFPSSISCHFYAVPALSRHTSGSGQLPYHVATVWHTLALLYLSSTPTPARQVVLACSRCALAKAPPTARLSPPHATSTAVPNALLSHARGKYAATGIQVP